MPDRTLTQLTAASSFNGSELLYTVQGGTDAKATSTQLQSYIGRIKMTVSGTHYFVRTTGNDNNDGLTVGTAWLTLQHAIDYLSANVDFCGFQIVVDVGAGSFAGLGVKSMTGGGNLLINGSGAATTTITGGPNDGLYNFGDAITYNEQMDTVLSINGVTLSPGASGYGLNLVAAGCIVCFGDFLPFNSANVGFGPATGAAIGIFGPSLVLFAQNAGVHLTQGASCAHFFMVENQGQIQTNGVFNCDNVTNYTTAFITVGGEGSVFLFNSWATAGNVSGKKFNVFGNSYLDLNGGNVSTVPGSLVGTIASGGEVLNLNDEGYGAETYLTINEHPFSALPSPTLYDGMLAHINDSTVSTPGWIVNTGGGTLDAFVRADGGNWRVVSSDIPMRRQFTAVTTFLVTVMNGTIAGGAGYTAGEYFNVSLTGGSGTTQKADIVVAGGVVTLVRPVEKTATLPYVVGDILSANTADIGGTGAGFTFTVTSIGNDTTGIGTAALPFQTLQACYDYIKLNYDLSGYLAVIQISNGVYNGVQLDSAISRANTPGYAVASGHVGGGGIQFQGNRTNVDAVVIDNTITGTACGFICYDTVVPEISLADLQLRVGGFGINLQAACTMYWHDWQNNRSPNMHFRFWPSGAPQIFLNAPGAKLYDYGGNTDLTYPPGSAAQRSVFDLDSGAFCGTQSIANITGNPNWSDAFIKLTAGANFQYNKNALLSYAGATGTRAWINSGCVLNTYGTGVTSIPGNSSGVFLNGGVWMDAFSNTYQGTSFLQNQPQLFAALPPAVTYPGMMAYLTDANAQYAGQAVTAGAGPYNVPVRSDGTNWLVFGGKNGISGTFTLAALTGGGAQGSLTFVNGLLTAASSAT